jgi:hypothetical protein
MLDSGPGIEPPAGPSPVAQFLAPGQDPAGPPPVGAVGQNQDGSWIYPDEPSASAATGQEPAEQPAQPTVKALPAAAPAPAAKPVSRGTGARAATQPDDTEQGLREGTNSKIQSEEDVADVAKQRGAQEAQEQGAIAQQQQALQDRDQKIQDYTQENQKRLLQKQEMLVNQYAGATVQSPRDIWTSMDTGHKILAGISLMLSGNGDGSPVMRSMENDIQAQKDQIERTGKAAGMVGNLFEEYSKMGLDSRQATQMAVNTATTIGVQRAKATAAQFVGPEAGAAVGGKIGDALIAQSRDIQGNHKTTADIALSRAQAAEAGERATGQHLQNKITQAQIDWQKQNNLPPGASPANMVHDLEGNQGYAVGGDADKKGYEDDTKDAANLLAAAQKIKTLRRGGSKSSILANQSRLQQEELALRQGLLGLSAKPGMLSARTEELAEQASGDPTRYFSILPGQDVEKRLDGIIDDAKGAAQRAEVQHNILFPQRAPPIMQRQGKVKRG